MTRDNDEDGCVWIIFYMIIFLFILVFCSIGKLTDRVDYLEAASRPAEAK